MRRGLDLLGTDKGGDGHGMDEYELVKQLFIEALYSRELSRTPEGERDGCASAIRQMKWDEVLKRKKDEAKDCRGKDKKD